MSLIQASDLTKDYGHGRGVFHVSFQVEKGECFGFLGPNGAGKTTTIRHLMGFSRPQAGKTKIMGKECFKHSAELQRNLGYLPGEIALPSGITGTHFLAMMGKMRGIKDDSYCKMLLDRFELDPNMGTKQMSLGVKRKLAIVTAFMHNPDILILDEPTSGLDPVMQQIFIDYILEEKKRGKTIFLSSHIFHEVDATCDRIAIIKDGRIVSEFQPEVLKKESDKIYKVRFGSSSQLKSFAGCGYNITAVNEKEKSARIRIKNTEINRLTADLAEYDIRNFQEFPFTLEDYFMQFYKEEKTFGEVK